MSLQDSARGRRYSVKHLPILQHHASLHVGLSTDVLLESALLAISSIKINPLSRKNYGSILFELTRREKYAMVTVVLIPIVIFRAFIKWKGGRDMSLHIAATTLATLLRTCTCRNSG